MSDSVVPTFYLYGEPHQAVAAGFVHVEDLDDRSRPSEWTIRPHAHAELNHLFLIRTGGGTVYFDADAVTFEAPVLIVVPATLVHGFAWETESKGAVITLAQAHLADIVMRHPDLATVFASASVIQLPSEDRRATEGAMATLRRELGWSTIGHAAAVEAALVGLMVTTLRGTAVAEPVVRTPSHQVALVARFRQRIELRFRHRDPVRDHAMALRVSESALRAACARVADSSPAQMVDARALLEARRALLYSNLTVAEIAYSTGFGDPAYFSRFFTRHTGACPRSYRASRGFGPSASAIRTAKTVTAAPSPPP